MKTIWENTYLELQVTAYVQRVGDSVFILVVNTEAFRGTTYCRTRDMHRYGQKIIFLAFRNEWNPSYLAIIIGHRLAREMNKLDQ